MNPDNTCPPPPSNHDATAYALGELTPEQRAAFEQHMENDPTLSSLARETQDFCALLDGSLRDPVPSLAEEKRAALLAAAGGRRRKSVIWVPWLAGAAAACVAGGIYFKDQIFGPIPQSPMYAESPLIGPADKSAATPPVASATAAPAARPVSAALLAAVKDLRYADAHLAADAAAKALAVATLPASTLPASTLAPPPAPSPPGNPQPTVAGSTASPITVKPDMPKPLFAGTPLPENNPPQNLDKSGKPVLEVTVPAGVTLISQGKPVTSSDPAPLGELSLVTDGDKEGDDGYYVDILPGKQWVQIDLGQSQEIHLIWMWHYHKVAAIYKDVVVQISDDPEFKAATSVFNNDWDNSAGFGIGKDPSWVETNYGRAMPVNGVTGRYVRCWSNGRNVDDTNHYIEVQVYGCPPGAAPAAEYASLTEAEKQKRQALTKQAYDAEREGDRLFTKQDFGGSLDNYRKALDTLPDTSATSPDRNRMAGKFGNSSVIQASEFGRRGEIDKAKALLASVLDVKVAPNHRSAQALLKQLNDRAQFKLPLDSTAYANTEEVKRLFNKGLGYYDLGQLNEAEEVFNHILTIDPYNTAARRQMERTQRETTNYLKSARDETRLRMLNVEDSMWVTAVPSSAKAPETAPHPQPASTIVAGGTTSLTVKPAMPKPLFAGTPLPDTNPPPNLEGTSGRPLLLAKNKPRLETVPSVDPAKPEGGLANHTRLDIVLARENMEETTVSGIRLRTGLPAEKGKGRAKIVIADDDLADGYSPSNGPDTVSAPGTESYEPIIENPFLPVLKAPLSTFSIDVDTASYSNVRRFLNMGQCPPPDAVRLEEIVNYFPYDYAPPVDGKPFAVHVEVTSAPWDETHRIARIALKGKEIAQAERPAANLVFLVDVSGSMNDTNKLPLVKQSLKFVVERLSQKDTVSLVTYAGESGVALPATSGADKARIMAAIEGLGAGGSTNGAGGISTAYQQAAQHYNKEGINRVILATDGDFNVGVTSHQELLKLITEKAKTGVFLSVLGYGMGNTKDDTMELLADKGNGNYAYIDGLSEARKALGDQFSGTLITIAKDVKIQIEFNPAIIRSYRLLGYENRMLAKEDFNNDKKDAGEIGAGHTVTALYELVPVGAPEPQVLVDDLKYQPKPAEPAPPPPPAGPPANSETMNIKLRWKAPDADVSQLMEVPLKDTGAKIEVAGPETKWAVAVAGFAAMLNGSQFNGLTWEQIRTLAKAGKGADPNGYRGEFLQLIDRAESVRR